MSQADAALDFLADVGFDPVFEATEASDSAGGGDSRASSAAEFNDGDIFVDVENDVLPSSACRLSC